MSQNDIDSKNSKWDPKILHVKIKESKTDLFRQEVTLYLGRTSTTLRPVEGVLPYLVVRGNRPGLLFICEDGKMITRQLFSTFFDTVLGELQLEKSQFNTHSFHIGAATSAKEAGITDTYIKMTGRWQSNAYLQYIHKNTSQSIGQIVSSTRNGRPMT